MQAVVLNPDGVRFDPNRSRPTPAAGEVSVRVLRAGICETDLQLIEGYMGFRGVLGHEFVGVAEDGRLQGQRVVGEINCGCGRCESCRSGMQNHCPQRSVLGILNHDGAFAEYVAVPETNLHAVPAEIDTETAVFTEPLAAAFEIPAQFPLEPNQRVIVLGDGRLGNLCAQVVALSGCRLTVVGKHPDKLALLARLGIHTVLLTDLQAEQNADLVVDCTGSATGLPMALRLVKPRGTVVLKTTVAGEQRLSMAPLVIDEITLVGSRCGPFDRALEALRQRLVTVAPLITARYALSDITAALQRARQPDQLKVLLDIGS